MEDQENAPRWLLFLEEMLEGDSRIRTAAFVDREGRIYYVTRNTQKVLDEDAFRQWISQQGQNFSKYPCPCGQFNYFTDSGNPVITFRRSYQDLTSFKTIGISQKPLSGPGPWKLASALGMWAWESTRHFHHQRKWNLHLQYGWP